MTVALSILPIFVVMALGFLGARRGFFPPGFIEPANRLAYWLAIPALILRAVANSPWQEAFQPTAALASLITLLLNWLLAMALSSWLFPKTGGPQPSRASWVQSGLHGNQAFIGLAVVFYALGQAGLNAAALVAAVVIIAQNFLSVLSLTRLGSGRSSGKSAWASLLMNPIILASALGLVFPLSGLAMPQLLDRTLSILGGMGLPLALLIIGAKLSEGRLGGNWLQHSLLATMKLMVHPALGFILLSLAGVGDPARAVTVILLAAPTATISVIMAGQLGGDAHLASEGVTLTHALSAVTYAFWLWLLLG